MPEIPDEAWSGIFTLLGGVLVALIGLVGRFMQGRREERHLRHEADMKREEREEDRRLHHAEEVRDLLTQLLRADSELARGLAGGATDSHLDTLAADRDELRVRLALIAPEPLAGQLHTLTWQPRQPLDPNRRFTLVGMARKGLSEEEGGGS